MFKIIPIDTPSLGDRSYLVHDGRNGFVVDPQRDIDRILEATDRLGIHLGHVFETHIHNDYVSGGRALATVAGATYHVGADDPVSFPRAGIRGGDSIEISPRLTVQALATPGHTYTHLSYLLLVEGRPVAVFTGGSLLSGSSGRTDLLGPEHAYALAHAQHTSARRLGKLPGDVQVFPTHGIGSFCSATPASGTASTIGREKRVNPALTSGQQRYVGELLAGLDAHPAYYAQMGPANLAAPAYPPDLTPPPPADPAELRRRIQAGEWVVDLRPRAGFAAGHLAGSISLGLDGSFATYLGWLLPPGTPVTLLGQTAEQVAAAQRELVRIGIERPAAAATGTPQDWSGGTPPETLRRTDFSALAEAGTGTSTGTGAGTGTGTDTGRVVLDVRRADEWRSGHLDGAVHLPLHDLIGRMDEIPPGEVWVHCQSGYRAALAASLLANAGRQVVHVDADLAVARQDGLPLVPAA